ncbi:hypothetical protein [Neorhodopirellula pilleata]|uniref:YcxB-like protein domain-containing protein n=1 Tax=Neorhodopirellula pilleata TaxID=2714738 RepID=A0A5C5ZZC0_9BACT|nr:hypothetical protein [Neorhodopirellula pilleata]TWT92639.1 hypothetical protein Pla100_46590 [Neorhodopirellula pilleata]
MSDSPTSDTPSIRSPEASVNPYQVGESSTSVDLNTGTLDDAASRVSFRLSKGVLRHAIDHLLLHQHPLRLSIGSLLMIFASGAAIFWAASQNVVVFVVTLVFTMVLSSLIYTSLIYRSKSIMRNRVRELGLVQDSVCVVEIEDERFVMTTSNGQHRWNAADVKVYRTPFGIVLCPEPMTPIYVPRRNNSPAQAMKTLRRKFSEAQTDRDSI